MILKLFILCCLKLYINVNTFYSRDLNFFFEKMHKENLNYIHTCFNKKQLKFHEMVEMK